MVPLINAMDARWAFVTAAYGISWAVLTLYISSVLIRLWKEGVQ